MRAKEFINEAKQGRITRRQQQSSKGINKFTDAEKWNGDYKLYRLGLALACTDGETIPDVDFESWIGRWKAAFPYTKKEQDMLKIAYAATKTEYVDVNDGDMRSLELDTVNKVSPVANKKRNRYGV